MPTLLILAAGMGSRYGGLKQMDPVGPAGESIIDYSIYDAIRAGFTKVVFVIRKDFEAAFREKFEPKIKGKIEVAYAYQAVDTPIEGIDKFPERQKPWGTGHAVLVAHDLINEPFAAINADDYYGIKGFQIMADFLKSKCTPAQYAMVAYELDKTLSDHGSVSRGICEMNETNQLTNAHEHTGIHWEEKQIVGANMNGEVVPLSEKALVSMNFWGFHHSLFDELKGMFRAFVKDNFDQPKKEFYIPFAVNELIEDGKVQAEVLANDSRWYGVTYKADAPMVQAAFQKLVDEGKYPSPLWG